MVAKYGCETSHKDKQDDTPLLCIFRKGEKNDTVRKIYYKKMQVNFIITLAFPTTGLS